MLLLQLQQRIELAPDLVELLQWCAAIPTEPLQLTMLLCLQGCYSHHKELIEIIAEDRVELCLFQQGGAWIQGLSKHPFVETDPAQLAVDDQLIRQDVCSHGQGARLFPVSTALVVIGLSIAALGTLRFSVPSSLCPILKPAPSPQPAGLDQSNTAHQCNTTNVTISPLQFWHVFEIHAVNPGNES
jgi:hypothetical protein